VHRYRNYYCVSHPIETTTVEYKLIYRVYIIMVSVAKISKRGAEGAIKKTLYNLKKIHKYMRYYTTPYSLDTNIISDCTCLTWHTILLITAIISNIIITSASTIDYKIYCSIYNYVRSTTFVLLKCQKKRRKNWADNVGA